MFGDHPWRQRGWERGREPSSGPVALWIVPELVSDCADLFAVDVAAHAHELDGELVVRRDGDAVPVIANADRDEQARQLRDDFWTERFERSATIVKRAVARGEIPTTTNGQVLLEDPCSPLCLRALVTNDAITALDVKTFAAKAIASTTREFKTPSHKPMTPPAPRNSMQTSCSFTGVALAMPMPLTHPQRSKSSTSSGVGGGAR